MSRARLAVADGVRYAVHDDGAGDPLLLLHGFTGSAESWAPLLRVLRRERRVIAVDLLGHGMSDAPQDLERHAVERQAADVADLLRRLEAVPSDVLGYSFGGRVALRLAIDHPGTVRALILESPSAGIEDETARAARVAADERWTGMLEDGDIDAFATAWDAQAIFASRRSLPAAARERLRAEQVANNPRALAASLRGAGQGAMSPMHARLHEIAIPTLVIAGALDQVGVERARVIASAIPEARLLTVPRSGHTPHLESPELFQQLVTAFLRGGAVEPRPAPVPVT